jgi:hypothetical protein
VVSIEQTPVPHRHYVLAIPKMLRPYFQHHRHLLRSLCNLAHESLSEYFLTALDCPKGVPGLTMLRERADRLKSATAVCWLTGGVRLRTALLLQAAVPRCMRGHALGAAHLRKWAVRSPASRWEWAKTAG